MSGYAEAAVDLAQRFEAISPQELYEPVVEHLPSSVPVSVLDVGAGTGRDARWLADAGHDVLAVEPVCELRDAAGAFPPDTRIQWLDDRLPRLHHVVGLRREFDCILVSAVWQHLDFRERRDAMKTLALLLSCGGSLIVSLRHGPGAPTWPVHPCDPLETVSSAERHGLQLVRRRQAPSTQNGNRSAAVAWTWLVFTKPYSKRALTAGPPP